MTTTNPTLLTMPIAKNGNKNAIPATTSTTGVMSQSLGFPPETSLPLGAGGVAPSREDFNGAFNFLSNIAFYAQKGWTFQYDATQDYFKGCIVIDPSDGLRYECLNDMVAGTVSPHEDTDNDYWKVFSTGGGVAVGFIMPYAGTGLQEGWLDCDGSAVSRTMYPDLFAAIGTTWGSGDGSTTFNLPRSEDIVLQGASALNPVGTYKSAGLPNIEGSIVNQHWAQLSPSLQDITSYNSGGASGALKGTSIVFNNTGIVTQNAQGYRFVSGLDFDASQSNAIYGNSDTVQPPAACVRFMIKAFDGPTPSSAGIDLTQYAQDLANRLTREQTPAFNKRDVIITSGTYTAPATGWYRITVKGGGGGGQGGDVSSGKYTTGCGGGEGGTTIGYEYLTAGDAVTVIVGAGGTGGSSGSNLGGNGGNSSATVNGNTYTGGGGLGNSGGGSGSIPGESGSPSVVSSYTNNGGSGGGAGGGARNGTVVATNGGGGAGSASAAHAGYAGGDGYVWFEYFAAV